MNDPQFNEEKEGLEAALNAVATYRGVPLCAAQITRTLRWSLGRDGNLTGPNYAVACVPSKAVKALIDASLDKPVDPPAPPPADPPTSEPPAPPPSPPAGEVTVVGQTLTPVSDAPIRVGDKFYIAGLLTLSDRTTRPVSAYRLGASDTSVVNYAGKAWTPLFVALAEGTTKLYNDNSGTRAVATITVLPADPDRPPTDPTPPAPPAPPPGSAPAPGPAPAPSGPVVPAPSAYDTPVPNSPVGTGTHAAVVEVDDADGKAWSAIGHTGDDPRHNEGLVACLVDAEGNPHPVLQVIYFDDACHVHACRMDAGYNVLGCKLRVTYDGQPVDVPPSSYADGTYDFWNGCWGPAIRYGRQIEPTEAELAGLIDWSVLPNYAKEAQTPLTPERWAAFDWSWNGLGGTKMGKMGTTGERGEIAFMQALYVQFLLNPTLENWRMVRKIEDHSGNWSMVFVSEPATGKIIKYTDYRMATILPRAQSGTWQRDNPIQLYGGSYRGAELTPPASAWEGGGSPFTPNTAHLTSYGCLASMITGTAHDRALLSFWANYCFIDQNPGYTRSGGFVWGAQRRFAWALRSVFMAAYYSSEPEYFSAELDRNLDIANAVPKNEFGILDTDHGYADPTGYSGLAPWMQSYLMMVLAPVANKRPAWKDFAHYVGKVEVTWASKPYAMLRTLYALICFTPDKTFIDDFGEIVWRSAVHMGYSEEVAKQIVAATTVKEAYDLIYAFSLAKDGVPMWEQYDAVNNVADYMGYKGSTSSYPAGAIASIASAANCGTPGIEQAVHIAQHQPTPIDYRSNQKYHIVPAAPAA